MQQRGITPSWSSSPGSGSAAPRSVRRRRNGSSRSQIGCRQRMLSEPQLVSTTTQLTNKRGEDLNLTSDRHGGCASRPQHHRLHPTRNDNRDESERSTSLKSVRFELTLGLRLDLPWSDRSSAIATKRRSVSAGDDMRRAESRECERRALSPRNRLLIAHCPQNLAAHSFASHLPCLAHPLPSPCPHLHSHSLCVAMSTGHLTDTEFNLQWVFEQMCNVNTGSTDADTGTAAPDALHRSKSNTAAGSTDRVLTISHLRHIFSNFLRVNLSDDELEEVLIMLDDNQDGKVTKEDFMHSMQSQFAEQQLAQQGTPGNRR